MNGKRPDLGKLSPEQKDALIRDLWRQVAAGQSEARLLKRRLGMAEPASEPSERVLLDKLRDAAPRSPSEPPAGISVKLGRRLDLWRSPVVLGVLAIICWRLPSMVPSGSIRRGRSSSSARRAC